MNDRESRIDADFVGSMVDRQVARQCSIVTVQGRRLSRAASVFCNVLREVVPAYSRTAERSRRRALKGR